MGTEAVIACESLTKVYQDGGPKITVLDDINFQVFSGDYCAIIGKSGSGKTTLLHMLAGLDSASSGKVCIKGEDLSKMKGKERGLIRNKYIGFVYQFHHLLPEFSALENVMMPLLIAKQSERDARKKAEDILKKVSLSDRLHHRPAKLSGGERQRVAIARAMVNEPACVLADEPTGNLDSQSSEGVHSLMKEMNTEFGTSFLIVTHDLALAKQSQKCFELEDGRLSNAS